MTPLSLTSCQVSSYGSPCLQQATQSPPICLLQASLDWNGSSIHSWLINAAGSWKVSCFCLLDLSAAFDTVDHSILITCLSSWFGIHGSALDWFKSDLSSCSFHVRCDDILSSLYTSCSIPQGCVLGSLLFVVYTTSQYSYFLSFTQPPPLCRWHSTFLFSPSWLWLQHCSPSEFSPADLFLDDCKSSNSQLIQDWIPTHRTHQANCQNPKLLTQHHPLCSQPGSLSSMNT